MLRDGPDGNIYKKKKKKKKKEKKSEIPYSSTAHSSVGTRIERRIK